MNIQRSQIFFVNLNPVQGREQAGERPVLVLSIEAINRLPLVVTVVVGTKGANVKRDYPMNVRVSPAQSGVWVPVHLGSGCKSERKQQGLPNREIGKPTLYRLRLV